MQGMPSGKPCASKEEDLIYYSFPSLLISVLSSIDHESGCIMHHHSTFWGKEKKWVPNYLSPGQDSPRPSRRLRPCTPIPNRSLDFTIRRKIHGTVPSLL